VQQLKLIGGRRRLEMGRDKTRGSGDKEGSRSIALIGVWGTKSLEAEEFSL